MLCAEMFTMQVLINKNLSSFENLSDAGHLNICRLCPDKPGDLGLMCFSETGAR